jgi:hypothetical protein
VELRKLLRPTIENRSSNDGISTTEREVKDREYSRKYPPGAEPRVVILEEGKGKP